jgi:hypothetical protein
MSQMVNVVPQALSCMFSYKNVNNKCYAKAWITPAITTSCINKRRLYTEQI